MVEWSWGSVGTKLISTSSACVDFLSAIDTAGPVRFVGGTSYILKVPRPKGYQPRAALSKKPARDTSQWGFEVAYHHAVYMALPSPLRVLSLPCEYLRAAHTDVK